MQNSWIARKCNNGKEPCKILPTFFHELLNNLARVIQESCKNHQKKQDSCMQQLSKIIEESCKYYPRIMQESCNISLRVMQYVLRCDKTALFCSPKKTEKNSKMCSKCPLSTSVPKNGNYTFTIHFQFQTMTQHLLVWPWESQHYLRL